MGVVLAMLVAAPAASAHGTFPGQNGGLVSSTPGAAADTCLELIDPGAGGATTQPGACTHYGGGFRISPDGNRFAGPMLDESDCCSLIETRIANIDGTGAAVTVYSDCEQQQDVAWSHDGTKVNIFDMCPGSACCSSDVLRVVRSDTGAPVGNARPAGYDGSSSWSRFGRIAWGYSEPAFGVHEFHTEVPEGCCSTSVNQAFGSVDWSPTANRLRFISGTQLLEANPDLTGQQIA